MSIQPATAGCISLYKHLKMTIQPAAAGRIIGLGLGLGLGLTILECKTDYKINPMLPTFNFPVILHGNPIKLIILHVNCQNMSMIMLISIELLMSYQ